MQITVAIATYRRPEHLQRCLDALKKQIRSPDEVLIIVRDIDTETPKLLESVSLGGLQLSTVQVRVPGLVAARNAGIDAAKGDIIAFIDDDTAPHPNWLMGVEAHFREDPTIGGLGGRDWIHHRGRVEDGGRKVVGKVQWFGRTIGNHHLGVGGPREVDWLKGTNMSYRRTAIQGIRFDKRLRGTGTEAAEDWAFSLAVKRAGWKIIYDPAVAVDHYPGPRLSKDFRLADIGDKRHMFDARALSDHVHNETLVLLTHLSPLQRIVFVIWAMLVGTRDAFGLVQWLRFLSREGSLSGEKLLASLNGRFEGWRTWRSRDV